MRTFGKIVVILLGLLFLRTEVIAQEVVISRIPVTTNVSNGRFEFIQSTIYSSERFLLDKYSGKVWRLNNKENLEEIPIDDITPIEADKINFQLYFGNILSSDIYLLNINTGELWKYIDNLKVRKFKKLSPDSESE